MIPKQSTPEMECAGSLTPELEGALRSAAHSRLTLPHPAPPNSPTPPKGDESA